MALRSLGSTLVAKAGTGSALRQKDETRMGGMVPAQAAGAQPDSQVRQGVQTPIESAVPAGSQKVVSTQPIMQPKLDAMGQSGMGLLGEMGGAGKAAETGRPIGSITQAKAPMVQAGAAPVSGGANIATKLSNTFGSNLTPEARTSAAKSVTAPTAASTVAVKNTAPSSYKPTGFLEGTFGGTVKADEPGKYDFNRNLAQGIASTLGGGIDAVGKFFQNILPEMGYSEQMQSFGNSPQASKDYGIMSNVRNAVSNVTSGGNKSSGQVTPQAASTQRQSTPNPWQAPAPSYAKPQQQQTQSRPAPAPAPKQNVVQQVSNWLRSLFR